MAEKIHVRDDKPKYGIQASQSSDAIFLGPLNPHDRGRFKDKEDATDMALLAVSEYVYDHPEFDGHLIADWPAFNLRVEIVVTDLDLYETDSTDTESENQS